MGHKTFWKQWKMNCQQILYSSKKWKVAKFSTNTKKEIFKRDWWKCIFCYSRYLDAHHVYFWTETNYWDNRNDINQGVSVCIECHRECHWCSKWEWKRQEAINYLLKIYIEK
jgi:hypothetical protein